MRGGRHDAPTPFTVLGLGVTDAPRRCDCHDARPLALFGDAVRSGPVRPRYATPRPKPPINVYPGWDSAAPGRCDRALPPASPSSHIPNTQTHTYTHARPAGSGAASKESAKSRRRSRGRGGGVEPQTRTTPTTPRRCARPAGLLGATGVLGSPDGTGKKGPVPCPSICWEAWRLGLEAARPPGQPATPCAHTASTC